MRVDCVRNVISRIKTVSAKPLDENMFVFPNIPKDSCVKDACSIGKKLRFAISKILKFFRGTKDTLVNNSIIKEETQDSIKQEALRLLKERSMIYFAGGEREKLTKEIEELVNAKPKLSNVELINTEVQKLLKERERHVKDYEITHYVDIRLNKDLYERQLDYLGLKVTEIPKEMQLNYDLAYWKDRYNKTGRDTSRNAILRIKEEMSKLGINERELSEVETLKAKYLEELKIYNNCESRIARIKEIDAKLIEIKAEFEQTNK